MNWITRAVFEDAFGPYRKGKTQYYVSSGLGIWGGKFRIGTRSEYIVLTIPPDCHRCLSPTLTTATAAGQNYIACDTVNLS